jgi:serine/threonine protein phosphatase PrpC
MEDRHTARTNIKGKRSCSIFGVYDGHSSTEAAKYAAAHLHQKIEQSSFFESEATKAIAESIESIDVEYLQGSCNGGTTACVAVINKAKLSIGNVGDSRGLLIRKTGYQQLTQDHTTDDPIECARIEEKGGFIIPVKQVKRV